MTLDRLISRLVSVLVRRLISFGIDRSFGRLRRPGMVRNNTTAEAGRQAKGARALAKRARQAAKITRRLGR